MSPHRKALPLVLALAACSHSTPPPPPPHDSGTPVDAGVDAGRSDAGGADSGAPDGGDAGIPPLTLTQVLPPLGESGGSTQVTLAGSGLVLGVSGTATGAQALTQLKFGSNSVIDFQIIDDNTIDARTPPGVAGPTDVTLTNPRGSVTCHGCFTYFDPLFATAIAPNNGPLRGGNLLTVTGSGFTADARVLVGGQSSPQVTLISSTQLQAVVPRGSSPGLVDVLVFSKNGVATLRRAYQYYPDLRVSNVSPLTGPLAGGTAVTLTGNAFDGATSVAFGGVPGTSLVVANSTQLTVNTPAAAFAGAVDVTVTTPRDVWTVRKCFTYFDASASLVAFAVFPHVGPAAGGNQVTVTGEGLSAGGLTVTIGGQAAPLVSQTAHTAVVNVPARGASARVVDVVVTAGASNSTLTGGYTYGLTVSAIAPAVGPSSGGTAASVSGTGLPPDADVFIGALQATLTGAVTELLAPVTTPAGAGGAPNDVWVRSHGDPEDEGFLLAAFQYDETLSVGRVQPNTGAIAGGTLVSVIGTGFGNGTVVSIGGNIAKDIKVIDTHTLSCRTPRADAPGTVDVGVTRLGQADTEPGGFSYFDPRSLSGGLSGAALAGTVNVSVIDVTQGFFGNPAPFANVMLGIDPATPFIGLTDDRGQITFSDPSLVKPLTVTVWKDGYQSATVTSVSTENVSVLITQTGGGGNPSPPPPGPPASVISGRVTGFKPPRLLQSGETLEARVFVAQQSFYEGPPYSPPQPHTGETWTLTNDGDTYTVFTGSGIRATYAILGIYNGTTGTFAPYLMGIHRNISADPNLPAGGMDIVLDTHLDMTVPVTVQGAISIDGGAAINDLYAWLDLGDEGFIPNPNNWMTGTTTRTSVSSTSPQLSFPNFPELDGSNFVFMDDAHDPTGILSSNYFTRQPGDLTQGLTVGPLLPIPSFTDPVPNGTSFVTPWDGTLSWVVDPGQTPDIQQAFIFAPQPFGAVIVWNVILPGSQTQVVLPPTALESLRQNYAGQTLYCALQGSRSSKFDYNQWTYDTLNLTGWTSYVQILSVPFTP